MEQYSYIRGEIMVWASLVRGEGSGEKMFRNFRIQVLQQGSSSIRVEAVPPKIVRENGLVSFRIKSDVDWFWMYACGMLVIFGHKPSFDIGIK